MDTCYSGFRSAWEIKRETRTKRRSFFTELLLYGRIDFEHCTYIVNNIFLYDCCDSVPTHNSLASRHFYREKYSIIQRSNNLRSYAPGD